MKEFDQLGLSESMVKTLQNKGFEAPTSIQEQVIPFLLTDDRDVIAQASTGTGKTAAFGVPIIEMVSDRPKHVEVLVLAPTRELAIQVAEEINSLKGKKKLGVVPIYGGQSIGLQLRQLERNAGIVVGTPGRVRDHIERKTLKLDKLSFLVLDEADEMLNMGFLEEVTDIMRHTNEDKRTLLFSATMSNDIKRIAKKYMGEFEMISQAKETIEAKNIDQIYFEVRNNDKFEALCRIIDVEEMFYGVVFCRTKRDVDTVAAHLQERGYESDGLHGDITQATRIKILDRLKKRKINILVATDVAARGIDISDLTHVINYSLPHDSESYVHRIGRTGRAGKTGSAITFVSPAEYRKLHVISKKINADIQKRKLPEPKDLVNIKKARLKGYLQELIDSPMGEQYTSMSQELLSENDAVDVLAAMLQHSFKSELSEDHYAKISERSSAVDQSGKTRLFISQGKKDKLDKKQLIDYIKANCKISDSKIYDVQILDAFSFVSLPFKEAEELLSVFKNRKKRMPILISKAKTNKGEGGGRGRSGGGSARGRSGGGRSGRTGGGRGKVGGGRTRR